MRSAHAPKARITHGVCITFRKERITQKKAPLSVDKSAFLLATNAIYDTGCIGLQSCIEMQPKKCMQPTDKLGFICLL